MKQQNIKQLEKQNEYYLLLIILLYNKSATIINNNNNNVVEANVIVWASCLRVPVLRWTPRALKSQCPTALFFYIYRCVYITVYYHTAIWSINGTQCPIN